MCFIKNMTGLDPKLGEPLQFNLWDFNKVIMPRQTVELLDITFEEACQRSETLRLLVSKKKIIEVPDIESGKKIKSLQEAAERMKEKGHEVIIIDKTEHPDEPQRRETTSLKRKVKGEDVGIGNKNIKVDEKNNTVYIDAPSGSDDIKETKGQIGIVKAVQTEENATVISIEDTGHMPIEDKVETGTLEAKNIKGSIVLTEKEKKEDFLEIEEEIVGEEVSQEEVSQEEVSQGEVSQEEVSQGVLLNNKEPLLTKNKRVETSLASVQCKGVNRFGKQCKKEAVTGYEYCAIHIPADLKARY